MLDLSKAKIIAEKLFRNDTNILLAYVFGSYVEGYENEDSDIDFAILFKNDIGLWDEMALQVQISEAIGFEKVDVVNLNKINLKIQFEVISKGLTIYESDKDTADDYIERVLHLYHQRQIRDRIFYEEYDASMKEDYIYNGEY